MDFFLAGRSVQHFGGQHDWKLDRHRIEYCQDDADGDALWKRTPPIGRRNKELGQRVRLLGRCVLQDPYRPGVSRMVRRWGGDARRNIGEGRCGAPSYSKAPNASHWVWRS